MTVAQRVNVLVGQIPVTLQVSENLRTLRSLMQGAHRGDLVVAPEGALTGYPTRGPEDLAQLATTDPAEVEGAFDVLASEAVRTGVWLWVGACLRERGHWVNAAIGISPRGQRLVYRKVNLATAERGPFAAGDELPVFDLDGVAVGVQLCREVRFPEQWTYLAERGAHILVHLNNGVGDRRSFEVWRSHLVSRAAETQRFVVSVNAAAPNQHCPSIVISPSGDVLAELPPGRHLTERVELDLSLVSDWYLSQRRTDIVSRDRVD